MRKRTIFLSLLGGIVALTILNGSVRLVRADEAITGPIDLAGVTRLEVSGAASDISISTRGTQTRQALLSGTRYGWAAIFHSAWFASGCANQARMMRDGTVLYVDMGDRDSFFGWHAWQASDDCRLTLDARLAPGASISITQNAARMRLDGDFSQIEVDSDAGDFALVGHATRVAVAGAALRARLTFERVLNTEEIRIAGQMLDATVRFLVPTPISYGVEAVASFVDSALPNTPGAKPDIRIKGEMARVRIE